MLKKLLLFFVSLTIVSTICVAGGLYWAVVLEPGAEIRMENIQLILGKESQVYYSDGKTRLGVFFDKAHRQYVSYREIPVTFVNALVASEDDRFFDHFGFDLVGIARAMVKNIQAGRVVQGGSTLTQQTAKNLFKRSDRSLQAKLKELLFALRLEYRYSKEQIFEFYANQFYVSGNGHGLGVAARYYFDKKPSELNLVESGFIAGSVKRPNFYNPFIKKSKEAADLARIRAKTRLKYVLGKMRSQGMIDTYTYNQAVSSEIKFKQGKVGFSLDYAMEMVKDAVSSTEVLDALAVHGITNVATSGIRVITTIDKDLQGKTLAILRAELSRLDVRMRGYEHDEVQAELAKMQYKGDRSLRLDAFLFGTIENITGTGKKVKIAISFGHKIGGGLLNYGGLKKLVRARVKWQRGLWSEPEAEDLERFIEQLQVGDRAWVRVRKLIGEKNGLVSLEKYPKVQGGAIVLQNGAIKGMAGGSENRFYNRAVYAKRTMGSAFKPYVFSAALQLGWNSADMLQNSRDVFVYHDMPYFPRPDHKSPNDQVSMSWAGVHSENVASVWLLSHITDKLSPAQFREVAAFLGLAPKVVAGEEEPYRTYRLRIRDRYGVVVSRAVLRATAYRQAVANVETDFIFDGLVEEYKLVKGLHYGLKFDKFSSVIDEQLADEKATLSRYEKKELLLRKDILRKNYLSLSSMRTALRRYIFTLESDAGRSGYDPFMTVDNALFVNRLTGEFSYNRTDTVREGLQLVGRQELLSYFSKIEDRGRYEFWQNVKLGSVISVAAFDMLTKQLELEYKKLKEGLPYSFETLSKVQDFRIMVGLQYLVRLAQELGVNSKLEPVLSFPLGSNVVTLLESTKMYETIVTGKVTTFGDTEQEESSDSLAIIDRIESAEGNILYKPLPESRVLIDDKTRLAVGHILENVVKFGTGRKADKDVRLSGRGDKGVEDIVALDLKIPLLGKTGTANRYTNASFFGYLPGLAKSGEAMTLKNGYAVGVYVGFDNNLAMRKKNSRITGSAGALPAWNEIVNVILSEAGYASRLDPVDLSFYGLVLKRAKLGQLNLAVDTDLGGKVRQPLEQVPGVSRYQPSIMTFAEKSENGQFKPARYFRPFWQTAAGSK